ncbi:HlyD family secretion protein [Mesorhizobium sp. B1-1-8]|uniref:HlyD family secretion protein n=1 Tax=Mesorhizobium sp. B1-1-8 TaxID=2589976 RepID=UPI001D0221CB|nr:efflux RND transporter periplasmic adaptor subunit [Mesorhizobium sp. B1-1-8]UCI05196.1 efflux RND transporter periplasmic adaptor subunit [Mesorhizobium sp. B1-1-8]
MVADPSPENKASSPNDAGVPSAAKADVSTVSPKPSDGTYQGIAKSPESVSAGQFPGRSLSNNDDTHADAPIARSEPAARQFAAEAPLMERPQPDPYEAEGRAAPPAPPRTSKVAATIVVLSVAAIVGLSLWYLVQPQPLLVQGEADATRIDIAARIDGRVAQRPVSRGDNIADGQVLVKIDNPELLTKLNEAVAAKTVALADLARIQVGTRAEVIAERKAAVASADANAKLAQQTYDRVSKVTLSGYESAAKLDEATASLDVAMRSLEQAKLAYQEAVAGATIEERGVAKAAVAKAEAAIATLQAQVAEMTVKAPVAAQVYQVAAEPGEYVSPGVPLLSLVDLSDTWLRFDLREDLVFGLKVGDHFAVKVPALGDKTIIVEVRTIATRGEYAGWRATRATGDFDLRTFEVRAYPVDKVPNLRPGMSAYADWLGRH